MATRFRKARSIYEALHDAAWFEPRRLVSLIAILGVYIQLAAAGACAAGSPLADIANTGASSQFPICHAQADDNRSAQVPDHNHAPGHQESCPFCSLHCHTAMDAPAIVTHLESPSTVFVVAGYPAVLLSSSGRFATGAPPRGPPFEA